MKKLFAMVIALALCCCILGGCYITSVEKETNQEDSTSMFVIVEEAGCWDVVYHKETRVMYVVSNGGYNTGNFTLLVNPDGTPMVWSEK
jgi:hypothetical protein